MADDALPPVNGLSFANRIEKVADTGRPNSICIIGKHKVGKTTLAASASVIPRLVKAGKKVLILESERGTASIAEDYPDVDLMQLTTFAGFNRAVDELVTKEHDYGVVVIDTGDKFQEYAVTALVDGAHDTRLAWGEVKKWMAGYIWRLHKSGLLVIVLIHETVEKDEKTGATTTTFKLAGGIKDDLGQIFDIIGRLYVDKIEGEQHRMLQLGPLDGQVTGSRYERKLPQTMIDPTMSKIFEAIMSPTASAATTDTASAEN